jgi:hypothetical protein
VEKLKSGEEVLGFGIAQPNGFGIAQPNGFGFGVAQPNGRDGKSSYDD